MFSFFSKPKGPKVHDVLYVNEHGCNTAAAKCLEENTAGIAAVWFPHELKDLRNSLNNISEH